MILKDTLFKRVYFRLFRFNAVGEDSSGEFKRHLRGLNFLRARRFAMLLFLADLLLLFSDCLNYQKGLWTLNPGYKLLFQSHLALGGVMFFLILVSIFLNSSSSEQKDHWQTGFAVVTSLSILCISAYTSGGVDQLLHQQITVYILAAFGVAALIYLNPHVMLLIYLLSYALFLGFLKWFQPDYEIVRGHSINGAILILIGWFFSVTLYQLHRRDFQHQKALEEMINQRTAMFEETMAREVTERSYDQEKIYRLASIVESTDDGIIGMAPDGTVLYWNQGAERVYGYTQEEIVGKSISMIFHENRQDELPEIFRNVMNGEKISHFETERLHKDGRIVEVSLTVSPITDDLGKIIGISTILRDISANKRMERELVRLDRLNLIGEMAAGISHEVRNPMTTVRGFLQLIRDKEEVKNYKSYFDIMIGELDRANSILTEFLSISRTKKTERRLQNLNAIVTSMSPLLEASAVSGNKGIEILLEELPDVLLDDKETRQVILNLSCNGLEAMEEGGTLTIRTFVLEDEAILEVRDQGRGISPELMSRLGTPFLTTKNEGTGLGLAICYGIVARHEARLEVESGESGSTFRVRFKITS